MMLSDQITAYLTQSGISFAPGDFQTGYEEGQPEQILFWSDKLGAQPTANQLAAAQAHAQQLALLSQCETAAQEYMDAFARTKGYDNMRAAVTYKDDPYGPFAADGAYALQARSQVWQAAQAVENSVRAGTMPIPASVADFLALLPKLAWPA